MTRLRVDAVHYAYPGGGEALSDVSFEVRAGERLAILGPNGAGKSTLLLHTNGLLLPGSGTVTLDDLPVTEQTLREVRRRVGLVFQDADDQLFLPTLLEDVAFGPLNAGTPPAGAEAAAHDTLARLGLDHAADRAAHHLSGGEKRLAALATVLVTSPGLLVLDEPTAGLDSRARARVVDLLRHRHETLLLSTHDLEVAAALCPRALVLVGGRVVREAAIPELLDDPGFLRDHGLSQALPRFVSR